MSSRPYIHFMEYKMVGNDLRNFRLEAGLTQEDVARAIGVTRQTVIAMEKGNYVPSVLLALMSARLFGRTVEELFYVIEPR
jgi:putative transcriptional regulator